MLALALALGLTALASAQGLPKDKWPLWPERFRATLVQNRSGSLALVTHYYDFKAGRSLLMIRSQLGATLFDYEFANGSTYYYDPSVPEQCTCIAMGVGLLRPDFLRTAGTYLGPATRDALDCQAWHAGQAVPPAKGPFMTYFALKSNLSQPVSWTFYTGARFDVMTWDVPGTALPAAQAQLPQACLAAKCAPPRAANATG